MPNGMQSFPPDTKKIKSYLSNFLIVKRFIKINFICYGDEQTPKIIINKVNTFFIGN